MRFSFVVNTYLNMYSQNADLEQTVYGYKMPEDSDDNHTQMPLQSHWLTLDKQLCEATVDFDPSTGFYQGLED